MNRDTILLESAYQQVIESIMQNLRNSFKQGDKVILNHPNYPGLNGNTFQIQYINGNQSDIIQLDDKGYPMSRSRVFWVDNKYLKLI